MCDDYGELEGCFEREFLTFHDGDAGVSSSKVDSNHISGISGEGALVEGGRAGEPGEDAGGRLTEHDFGAGWGLFPVGLELGLWVRFLC